jgi:hypothetical protein
MKRLATLFLLIAALPVPASIVVQYQTPNGEIVRVIQSADTLAYLGHSNTLINPAFPTNALRDCYVTNGVITAWTANQLATNALVSWLANSNQMVWNIRNEKTNAVNQALQIAYGTNAQERFMRAMLLSLRAALDQVRTNPTANLGTISTNSILMTLSNAIVNDPK